METELSPNKEIENYEDEDTFDFKIKADVIIAFLEFNVLTLKQNKMLALYGNWGSGKTSLMKYIDSKINKSIYFPIFFHAWEHEKDENLALSLCDILSAHASNGSSKIISSFKENSSSVLKGFTSGFSVKLSKPLIGLEASFEGDKALKGYNENTANESFYKKNEKFKDSFRKIENMILKRKSATRLIVFVDDLDRCEPENVLNLITALKLFFTYGDNTIYFTGLDKNAVTKAVATKYNDVIKSEEYLEKVFDITFSIPKTFSLEKYLSSYFKGSMKNSSGEDVNYVYVIDHFFRSIHFTNPRHIKKILNKYEILKAIKKNPKISEDINLLVPNILDKSGDGNVFETIFCLFFIILYENYPQEFEEIENYKRKLNKYIVPYIQSNPTNNNANRMPTNVASSNLKKYLIEDISIKPLKELLTPRASKNGDRITFIQFLLIFSNDHPQGFSDLDDRYLHYFQDYFLDNGILTLFCKFLIKHKHNLETDSYSDYVFWDYFKMAKYLL